MTQQVITVFGGTGFVGRHVVNKLAASGAIIRIAVRDAERALPLKLAGTLGQIVPWPTNINDVSQIKTAVHGADVVINLVGIIAPSGKNTFDQTHHISAGHIATLSREAGVKKLIHVSALGADINSPSKYSQSKAMGEEAVRQAYPNATILRPSVIFGAEDQFFNMFAGMSRFTPFIPVIGAPVFPKISWTGGPTPITIDFFGQGGPKFQPVFVDDVAKAVQAAATNDDCVGQTYELGGPSTYSYKSLMELVMSITKRQRILTPLPFGMATLMAWFLQKLPKPILTCDQITLMQTDNVVAADAKTFVDLKIIPISAETILPTYLERFRVKQSTPSTV